MATNEGTEFEDFDIDEEGFDFPESTAKSDAEPAQSIEETVKAQVGGNEALTDLIAGAVREQMAEFEETLAHRDSPTDDLVDKQPEDAVDEYLEDVRRDSTPGTHSTHKSRLGFFIRWTQAEEQDGSRRVEYLSEVTGQDIKDFRDWRRAESDWKSITEESQMKTLRKFLEYCEKPEWVVEGLSEKVPIPIVDSEDESRDEIIRQSKVDEVLAYQATFEYTKPWHITWLILGRTGCRISDLRALDVEDYVLDEESGKMVLKFRSREETETRLKNGKKSERDFEVKEEVQEVLDDYLEDRQTIITDDNGREPLVVAEDDRIAASTVRKYVYSWSRPCALTGECPLDYDIEGCEAAQNDGKAYKCPESASPHPIRRGRITWHLKQGVLPQMLEYMYDVSKEVMQKHYDERTHAEKQRISSMWTQKLAKEMLNNFDVAKHD